MVLKKIFLCAIILFMTNNSLHAWWDLSPAEEGRIRKALAEKPNFEEAFKNCIAKYDGKNLDEYDEENMDTFGKVAHNEVDSLKDDFLTKYPNDQDTIVAMAKKAHDVIENEGMGCEIQ